MLNELPQLFPIRRHSGVVAQKWDAIFTERNSRKSRELLERNL